MNGERITSASVALVNWFKNLRLRVLGLIGARNNRTEPIDGGAHDLNILLRPREVLLSAFAIEQAHRVLDRVRLLEDLRDRLTQVVLVGSAHRGHATIMGTKGIHFKTLSVETR